jgi:FtsP/CotA-like multicopper oxidase with cupredoxin domain
MRADDLDSAKFISRFMFKAIALIVVPLTILGVVSLTHDPAPAASSSMPSTLNVSLSEFAITGDLTTMAGDVTLIVTNKGSMEHNLTMQGGATTGPIPANGTATLKLGALEPGSYALLCTIPGHADSGMKATLVVEAMDGSASNSANPASSTTMDYAAMDAAMVASIKLFPAKTIGKGNQPLQPKVLADGTKEFALTSSIVDWEVSPGKIVKAWAYNGQVPGPEIRVGVGDKVRVVLTNHLPMGTDVHIHGLDLPFAMDGVAPITQEVVKENASFVYEFTTTRPAVAMYHAHMHGEMQVPNGLFGAFYVGDMPVPAGRVIGGTQLPADLPISQKISMVLNDAGSIGLSLNGKSFPATEPYVVKSGDWIEVSYFNEGLQIHPMHQHQFPQLVIAKDGFPLDQPYWVDTLAVAPGERYTVLVNPNKVGTWVWHCHILTHVESDNGMFGMVTALVVQ